MITAAQARELLVESVPDHIIALVSDAVKCRAVEGYAYADVPLAYFRDASFLTKAGYTVVKNELSGNWRVHW